MRATVFAAAAIVLSAAACRGPQSTLDPAGPAADAIAGLWWLMAVGACAVWVLVMALLLWTLRRGDGPAGARRPLLFIVGGGVVLPTAVLGALLVHGTLASDRITARTQRIEHVVEVIGRQWQWEFRHVDADGRVLARSLDVLRLPQGRLVEFRVASDDVIHSFWIPRLGGKIDAIPGVVNRLRLRADAGGPMRGQCAEFCGLAHARMGFDVQVLPADHFDAWLRDPGGPAPSPPRDAGDASVSPAPHTPSRGVPQ